MNTSRLSRRWNAQFGAATYCSFYYVAPLVAFQMRPNSVTAARPESDPFDATGFEFVDLFRRSRVPTESIGKADNFIDDLIVII